jgi:glycosyltransferase involved in cell wall biosynthesis
VSVRVLQSFPDKIGAGRICTTAWHQAVGATDAGGDVTVFAGAVARPLPRSVRVRTTLGRGRWRIPYRVLGERAYDLHDWMVARALPSLVDEVDVVHAWPLAALETLKVARRLGIPTVLERPNAHTRFAYEVVGRECDRLGVTLPPGHEHAYNAARLAKEEEEYTLADRLLCPSEFVMNTFLDYGFPAAALARHAYGYDESVYYPPHEEDRDPEEGLNALFVGVCAVRKGLHFALEAWLRSPASRVGRLRIAGAFVPEYEAKLADMLAHPSVEVLGHRDDAPDLMRRSDVLLLPTLEEGSPLACMEAMASGCVPIVSDVCSGVCTHEVNALVHRVGDVDALTGHITALHENRVRLAELRVAGLKRAPDYTWAAAGSRLLTVYESVAAPGLSPATAAALTG